MFLIPPLFFNPNLSFFHSSIVIATGVNNTVVTLVTDGNKTYGSHYFVMYINLESLSLKLYTWNYDDVVCQLYFNEKYKLKKNTHVKQEQE